MSAIKEYSRAYLQYLPEERKQAHIKNIIQHILRVLLPNAAAGNSSYFYDMSAPPHPTSSPAPIITNEEYVAGFKSVFTDCTVSYAEEWVEVPANHMNYTRQTKHDDFANHMNYTKQANPMAGGSSSTIKVLQKGITIDWS